MPCLFLATPAAFRRPSLAALAAIHGGLRAGIAGENGRKLRAWQAAFALALLATALQLLVVLAPSEHLSPGWVYPEELHRGNIAAEVLQGPLLPLQDYHHAPNVGGSVVVGLLAAPFVALFGPSIVAVRLVPILFHALTVALVFLVLERTYGRRAAWVGGLFMAVAAPGYALVSVTAWGTHHEGNALSMACVLLALGAGAATSPNERVRGIVRAFFLGLVAGFSVYFGYMAVLALATLFAFALLHDKLVFLRLRFWACVCGAALGFIPWLTYNVTHDFKGLQIYGEPLYDRVRSDGAAGFFANIGDLLTRFVPTSFYFRDLPLLGDLVPAWTIYLAFGVLVVAAIGVSGRSVVESARTLVRRRPIAPAVLFLLYLPVFALAFALYDVGQWGTSSGIAHDGRYPRTAVPVPRALRRGRIRGPRASRERERAASRSCAPAPSRCCASPARSRCATSAASARRSRSRGRRAPSSRAS